MNLYSKKHSENGATAMENHEYFITFNAAPFQT
jgi:hypothetical protein